MARIKANSLLLAIFMVVAFDFVCSRSVDSKSPTEAKLTFQQKVDSLQRSNRDIEHNTIAGSSDYVSDSTPKRANGSQRVHFDETASSISLNTTSSQANVFQATAPVNGSHQRDPLLVNAQSPNPFLSNVPGGVNPQIAMLMQNNPRLQMLARQNPIVAQQILRNPALLRDPQINRAIQSQLSPGQGQNLLGQLGQVGLLNGLGRALNPLGLPLGINSGLLNRQQGNQINRLGQNQQNQNQNNQLANQMGNNFGLPRSRQPAVNPHRQTLPGGYYGNTNNGNANPSGAAQNAVNESDEGAGQGGDEGVADNGNQDYDGNTGTEEDPNAGAEDSQQNPAEDPDIQQLQNFGGPVNDNFPEGLFPPGLLTKEDIDEIRKQQERQQKESEERERQQQQQQNPQAGQGGADYEDTGEDGTGGEEVPAEGNGQEGEDEVANTGPSVPEQGQQEVGLPVENNAGVAGPSQSGGYSNPNAAPPAYKNAYQAIQPVGPQRGQLQPSINYANDFPNSAPLGANRMDNPLNYQSGVQYNDPNSYQMNNNHLTTTPTPMTHQYGQAAPNPLLNNFNGPPQPSHFGGYNRQRPHIPQPVRPWQANPSYNHNGGFNTDPRQLQANQGPSLGSLPPFRGNNNALHTDQPYGPYSTPNPAYRSNVFNQQRPAFQTRPRGYLE